MLLQLTEQSFIEKLKMHHNICILIKPNKNAKERFIWFDQVYKKTDYYTDMT